MDSAQSTDLQCLWLDTSLIESLSQAVCADVIISSTTPVGEDWTRDCPLFCGSQIVTYCIHKPCVAAESTCQRPDDNQERHGSRDCHGQPLGCSPKANLPVYVSLGRSCAADIVSRLLLEWLSDWKTTNKLGPVQLSDVMLLRVDGQLTSVAVSRNMPDLL